MESKRAEGIKNLLLKIIIPLAFPLAGSFIFDLITNRANRHSDRNSSDSSIQLDPSYGSSSTREEEEEEMDSFHCESRKLVQAENPCSTGRLVSSEFARQASRAEDIMVAQATDNPSEVADNGVQDDRRIVEEIETLKNMVSSLEERAANFELEFHDYCDMKEQESTYQKMQIMCLGMKLELLESQNQRLEAAVMEIRAAAEEFATMRAKLDALQHKFKKISKKSKQDLDSIDERLLALDAKEAATASRCEGFEQHMEEMKQLTLQLQKEKGRNNENVEVIVERSMRKLSSSTDVLDGLEALRDRWAADMEEMIYLGWITAWLQHDLLVCDDGEGTGSTSTMIGDIDDDVDDGDAPYLPLAQKKGEKMVVSVAPGNEVELCNASSNASSEMRGVADSCMGLAVGCRGIRRPRLLHRLRGWAGGKGKSRRPCGIEGPSGHL